MARALAAAQDHLPPTMALAMAPASSACDKNDNPVYSGYVVKEPVYHLKSDRRGSLFAGIPKRRL